MIKQVPLSFFPDAGYTELVIFHAFGCYLLTCGDSSSNNTESARGSFPFLRPNTAAKVSEIVNQYVDIIPGVPEAATDKYLRVFVVVVDDFPFTVEAPHDE